MRPNGSGEDTEHLFQTVFMVHEGVEPKRLALRDGVIWLEAKRLKRATSAQAKVSLSNR